MSTTATHSTLGEIEEALKKLDDSTLQDVLKQLNVAPKSNSKRSPLELLLAHSVRVSVAQFVERMLQQERQHPDSGMLNKALEAGDYTTKEALPDYVVNGSLSEYLRKFPLAYLILCCQTYGLEVTNSDRQAMEVCFQDELLLNGFQWILLQLRPETLRSIGDSLQIAYKGSKREALADAVMCAVFQLNPPDDVVAAEQPAQRKKPAKSRVKPENADGEHAPAAPRLPQTRPDVSELKPGMTYDEIFQRFWKEDLDKFCRMNGLKTTKKTQQIKDIIHFLNTGQPPPAKGKKRKGGGGPRTKRAKATTDQAASSEGAAQAAGKEEGEDESDTDEGDDNNDEADAAAPAAAAASSAEQKSDAGGGGGGDERMEDAPAAGATAAAATE